MAGGVLGKLGVKVIPDLDGFKQELERKLRRVAAETKDIAVEFRAEVEVDKSSLAAARERVERMRPTIHAHVDVDQGSLHRAQAALNDRSVTIRGNVRIDDHAIADIGRKLDEMRAHIKASIDIDESSRQKALQEIARLERDIDLKPNISAHDLAEIRNRINNLKTDLRIGATLRAGDEARIRERIADIGRDIKLHPEMDAGRVRALKAQLQHAMDDIETHAHLSEASKRRLKHEIKKLDADVTVNVDLDKGKATAGMAVLTRDRIVNLKPVVDSRAAAVALSTLGALSGGRALSNYTRDLKNLIAHLDETSLKAGLVASGLLTIGSAAGSAVGHVTAVATALVRMAPALYAVPGAAIAAATGVATLVMSLKDFQDRLPDVVDGFKDLQKSVSNAFWERAEAPMREMANNLLPVLQDGLAGVARAQGGWVEAIAATVNKQSVLDAIAKSIENTRLATEVASTGIGRMAEGIIHLGSVGSQYLPRLAEWFNKIADKFANWAEAGASNGSIESAIERAIDAAKKLWDIIMSLVGIMKSFAKAAEDAGFTLDYAVERTRAIENALKSLEGRQILTDLFSGALQGMENFRAQLEGLGPLMVRISNTIRQAMEIAGEVIGRVAATLAVAFSTEGATKGVIDFFNGILSAVKSLQAVAPQMGEIFGAITSFAGTLAHIVGEVLATAIRELGPSLVKLLDALKPVVEIIGTALVQAIQTVSPWLTKIIDWIAAMDPAVLAAVVVGIGGVAAAFKGMSIVSEIVTALEGIAAVLGGAAGWVAVAIAAIAALAAGFLYLWNTSEGFRNTMVGIGEWIASQFQVLLDWWNGEFLPAWNYLWTNVQMYWEQVGKPVFDRIMQFWDGFAAYWNGIWSGLSDAWNAFWGIMGNILSFGLTNLGSVFKILTGLMTGDWGMAWQGVKELFSNIWEEITQNAQLAWDGFCGLAQTFRSTAAGIFNGFIRLLPEPVQRGLADMGRHFLDAHVRLLEIATQIVDGVGRTFSMMGPALAQTGRLIVDTVVSIFHGAVSLISGAWQTIKDAVVQVWQSLPEPLRNFASEACRAIANAFHGAVGWVADAARRVFDAAVNVFRNVGNILYQAGVNLIQGFINGIKSMYDNVKSWLGSLTNMLPSWKGPAPKDRRILYGAGVLVIQGFINGMESSYGDVRKSLSELTTDMNVAPDFSKLRRTMRAEAASLNDAWLSSPEFDAPEWKQVNIVNHYPVAKEESEERDEVAEGIRLAGAI